MATKKKVKKTTNRGKKAAKKKSGTRTVLKGKKDVDKFYDNLRTTQSKGKRRGQFYAFQPGTTIARPVPFQHDGSDHLFAPNRKHFLVKGEEPVLCPKGDDPDAKCAICDAVDSGSQKASSKGWIAHFVIVEEPRGANQVDPGTLVIANCCKTIMDEVTDFILDPDKKYAKKGIKNALEHDIEIVRGKNRKTGFVEYTLSIVRKKGKPVDVGTPRDLIRTWEEGLKDESELEEIASNL
jgi:hypothetical protein